MRKKIIFGCVFMEDFSPLNSVAHDCHGWFCCLLKEMGTRAETCEREAKGPKADASMRVMQLLISIILNIITVLFNRLYVHFY